VDTDDLTPPEGLRASNQAQDKSAGRRDLQKRIAACRNRLKAVGAVLDERDDEGALDDVAQKLHALLSDLEREHADEARIGGEAGIGAWLRGMPRSRLLLLGGVAALLAVVLVGVMLRGTGGAAREARYDEIFIRAGTLLAEGKNAEAAQAYRKALAILPDAEKSADGYNNLGWALQKQGKLDEAIEAYSTALKIKPTWQLPANNLAAARTAKAQGGALSPSPGPP
jgi:tetratricopeptide (TPR) repeat protein